MTRSPFAHMQDASDGVITKTMAITIAEFERGMARLGASRSSGLSGGNAQAFTHDLSGGQATLSFALLPPKVLGGLMKIMQAGVTLTFEPTIPLEDRQSFLDRFDLVFQRGGG